MQKVIVVEENLSNVDQALQSAGFRTVGFDSDQHMSGVGAIVVSGQNQNFLGMHDTQTKIPVISAEGRSADEVVNMVKEKLV